jgi:hypothetical protein
LKAQAQPAASATGAAAVWPPAAPSALSAKAAVNPPVVRTATRQPQAPAFAPYQLKRRPSLWRRVKNTLLGTPEPVLEDSL